MFFSTSFFKLTLLLLTGFLYACGGGDDSSDSVVCTVEGQNQFISNLMHDFYFWYEFVPQLDPLQFDSPQDTLEALKYKPLDRFSFIAPQQEFDQLFEEGQFVGVGISFAYDDNERLRMALVFENSPAQNSGLKRGDQLLSVNGLDVAQLVDADAWEAAWGPEEIGIAVDLEIVPLGSADPITLTLTKQLVTINSTYYHDVLDAAVGAVGYLVFTHFFENSSASLSAAFSDFQDAGIQELVLDLRYNGGGLLSTANHLGNLIGATQAPTEIMARLNYNDQYQNLNHDYLFIPLMQSLDLTRVVVLTSGATCSASEALINGLAPVMEVITVGADSCGKPVGFNGQAFCDQVALTVNFEIENSLGIGEYFDGLGADCNASDDLERDLGDPSEDSLATALGYLESGICPQKTMSMQVKPKILPMDPWRQQRGSF